MKPLLVGEVNPYGADPYYALYPDPPNSAGGRLCRLVMGLDEDVYLESFDRANLCERRWSLREARRRAEALWMPGRTLVLLGRKVCDAFEQTFQPFRVVECSRPNPQRPAVVVLPHPSGLNRMWNQPGAFEAARAALRVAGVLP